MVTEKRILVIDDDIACRKACVKALSVKGFDVMEAEDGESALELFKNNSFNVVVTDLMMPGISGLDVLKYIKETSPLCDVIIITAYPTVETSVEALRMGVADYITKPIKINELNSKVKQCIEEQRKQFEKQNGKEVFTSYEVSKLCAVTMATVTNWVNQKLLSAYKTPGGHRRIKKEDLIKFLKKYKMPMSEELE